MPVVTNSPELRTAIQNATSGTVIDLAASGSPYAVDTLAKFPCATPLVPQSGYTIQTEDFANTGIKAVLSNTRIYQQNIDGPYAPGTIKDVVLNYTTGTNAIFRATSSTYVLNGVDITGTHSGWAGNGNVYMSMTVSNGNTPIAARLDIIASTVSVTGQGGYNAAANTGNASAFLQSWNNIGIVTGSGAGGSIAVAVNLEAATFDEAGFKTSFHFANMLPGGAAVTPTNYGKYLIINSIFQRTSNQNLRDRGNRLESVDAFVAGNSFSDGSYLDLAGNISFIEINSANEFNTLYGGKGINFTKTSSSGAALSATSTSTISGNFFYGYGLAFTYAATGANDVFTVNGTNFINVNGTFGGDFQKFLTGGSGNNSITTNGTNDWIYGGAGNDNISASGGNDWIIGGTGADTITPGSGADTILYYGTDEGSDTINNFVSGTDKLAFRTGGGGATAFSLLTIFETTAPTTAGPTLSYVGGVLTYDANGNGAGGAVTIATFVGSPAIAASDIQLF